MRHRVVHAAIAAVVTGGAIVGAGVTFREAWPNCGLTAGGAVVRAEPGAVRDGDDTGG